MSKVFTVRLPENQVVQLEKLATIDGVAVAEEIRLAIARLWEQKKNDQDFKERVRKAYKEARALLHELGDADEVLDALGEPPVEAKEDAPIGVGAASRAGS